MAEKVKDNVTQIAVHNPASFDEITRGVLLKTPKSNARKTKIKAIKIIQTIIKVNFCKDSFLNYNK